MLPSPLYRALTHSVAIATSPCPDSHSVAIATLPCPDSQCCHRHFTVPHSHSVAIVTSPCLTHTVLPTAVPIPAYLVLTSRTHESQLRYIRACEVGYRGGAIFKSASSRRTFHPSCGGVYEWGKGEGHDRGAMDRPLIITRLFCFIKVIKVANESTEQPWSNNTYIISHNIEEYDSKNLLT